MSINHSMSCVASEVESPATYWYEGGQQQPLTIHPFHAEPDRQPLVYTQGQFRKGSNKFLICLPQQWDETRTQQFEEKNSLNPTHIFETKKERIYQLEGWHEAILRANQLFESNDLLCAAPLWQQVMEVKSDPLYSQQWNLEDSSLTRNIASNDIDIQTLWGRWSGAGSVIGIVDDGLEINHEDLEGNVIAALSRDYVDEDSDPTAGAHGTMVAGLAAAEGFNGIGIRGVAPAAGLVGYRLIAPGSNLVDEADLLLLLDDAIREEVDVLNNSWGPVDDYSGAFERPTQQVINELNRYVQEGRAGKGGIVIWAGGNGGTESDASNLDGYSNQRVVISVTATDEQGRAPTYSERGSNILISAPGGDTQGLISTDRSGSLGYSSDDYSAGAVGTSVAAPQVAGLVGLLLEVDPELGWRDIRSLLALSADQVDPDHELWGQNRAGHWVSERYGFGQINARRTVSLAEQWSGVATEVTTQLYTSSPNLEIPDDDEVGVMDSVMVTESIRVESVAVTVNIPDHTYWGDLGMWLTSPLGTTVELVHPVYADTYSPMMGGYHHWTMGDVLHFGENSEGDWQLQVVDLGPEDEGRLESWSLEIFGTEIPVEPEQMGVGCEMVNQAGQSTENRSGLRIVGSHSGAPYQQSSQSGKTVEDYSLLLTAPSLSSDEELLATAKWIIPGERSRESVWFQYRSEGWVPWSGVLETLNGFESEKVRQGGVAELYRGQLEAGQYQIYSGIRKSGEPGTTTIEYCSQPIEWDIETLE
jgi:subtilisin-like proprotein convertase family protein